MTAAGPSPATAAALEAAGLDPAAVAAVVRGALEEDLAGGLDVTSQATVPEPHRSVADVVARTDGVVAGVPVACAVFELVDPTVETEVAAHDGERVTAGQTLLSVRGATRSLLTAERTALNLLCHLSGVATLTRTWVDAVAGTKAVVRDTRKTTPGLRALEKYAVRCGGGVNHRMSLSDAVLVKDNHVVAAGGVGAAFRAVRSAAPLLPVQVECDTLDQVVEALEAGADHLLLDNFGIEDLRAAVSLVMGRARLEASGGLTLGRARAVAATGVDYLAVGALTHSAPALDIGVDLKGA